MSLISIIREKLEDRNTVVVAERCGVHVNTLHKIKKSTGDEVVMKTSTLKKIADYLEIETSYPVKV